VSEENKAMVRRMVEGINAGLEEAARLLATDRRDILADLRAKLSCLQAAVEEAEGHVRQHKLWEETDKVAEQEQYKDVPTECGVN
jgi:hypothetical protein